MQYTVEELSPVKKTVSVTVGADEVDAAITSIATRYQRSAVLKGFRKGKAPLKLIERKFAEDIYNEAGGELINNNISSILKELDAEPLGGIDFDGKEISRGQDYAYSFSFEVMPIFDLPAYEGREVEEESAVVDEAEIDQVIDRVRKGMASLTDVEDVRAPQEGDVVTMDFAGTDEEGKEVPGVSGQDFVVNVGEKQVIDDFEKLVLTAKTGETVEGLVTFPEDYHSKELAGKPVTMKITVKKIQTRDLAEVDDEFAKKAGGFDTVEAMRESIRSSYGNNRKEMAKAKAQSELLEKLLDEVDFPLPEGMVERYTTNIISDRIQRMQKQGQIGSLKEEDLESMRAEAKTEAEKFAKTQLFLLTVAKKEELDASPQEMEATLRQMAMRSGQDVNEMREHYVRNNLLGALRDRILADKAMETLYEKASVTEKAPEPEKA